MIFVYSKSLTQIPPKNSLEVKYSLNKIADELWPALIILRSFGKLPITKNNSSQSYHYSWRSFHFFYCLTLTFYYVTVWTVTIAHTGSWTTWFSYFFRPQTSKSQALFSKSTGIVQQVAKSYFVLQAMSLIVDFICPWFSLPGVVKHLNGWRDFQSEYETGFRPLDFKLNKYWVRSVALASIPTICAICTYRTENMMWIPELGIILSISLAITMTFLPLLQDAMVNLHFKAIEKTFCLIKDRVKEFPNETMTCDIIRRWTNLWLQIRKQHELLCRSYEVHQLTSLFLQTVCLTICIFLIIQCLGTDFDPDTSDVTRTYVLYSIFMFVRIYNKCAAAEGVQNEEKLLAQILVPKISACKSIFVKNELKFLYTLITNQPTTVTYGVITVNKKFMLAIISQVIAYFIILIQFNISVLVDTKSQVNTSNNITSA
ncbi:unnamed protein product [Allacma fusca]|uniref:Gustatory receptor n=1 Tax=Allacma fusca TaxID=39272 RepID=A0A8J2P1R4_9HEXA|nr:unnamed protein product [Allacma fusca]